MRKSKKIKSKHVESVSLFSSKSFRNVLNNYKKNKEQKKIREIKLKKLAENNQLIKDRKELRSWEERLSKENTKIKFKEEELN